MISQEHAEIAMREARILQEPAARNFAECFGVRSKLSPSLSFFFFVVVVMRQAG
jgi:hypothetical protein